MPAEAKPAAPAAPAAAPAAAPSSPSLGALPVTKSRPTISAAKAFDLPEAPSKTARKLVKEGAVSLRGEPQQRNKIPQSPTAAPANIQSESDPFSRPPSVPFEGSESPATRTGSEEVETPAAPTPEPTPTPAAATPTPAAPDPRDAKIEELTKKMEELGKALQPKETPQAPAEVPKTEEQKKAEFEASVKRDKEWIAASAKEFHYLDVDPEQLDTILAGGKEGAQAFKSVLATALAENELKTRAKIYSEINPMAAAFNETMNILWKSHQALEDYQAQQLFASSHPELTARQDVVRNVEQELKTAYPREWSAMTAQQRADEVARQSEVRLSAWAKQLGYADWKQLPPPPGAAATPAPVVPSLPTPPAGVGTPQATQAPVAAAPAPAPAPAPRPPVPMAPAGGGVRQKPDWNKSVAASLQS